MVSPTSNAVDEFSALGGVDESSLYLRVGDCWFCIYELSLDRFAVAAEGIDVFCEDSDSDQELLAEMSAPAIGTDSTDDSRFSGQLVTKDGDVHIPVSFSLEVVEAELLFCTFCDLSGESLIQLRDLLDLLDNDWDEAPEKDRVGETEPALQPSREVAGTSTRGVLETSDGQQIYPNGRRSTDERTAARWHSHLLVRVGVGLCVVSAIVMLGLQFFSGSARSAMNEPQPANDLAEPVRVADVQPVRGSVGGQQIVQGAVVAEIKTEQSSAELRSLKSELELASAELKTYQARVDSALESIESEMRTLKADVGSLSASLQAAANEQKLAAVQWERIRLLAEKDNVGRKEVERVKLALVNANNKVKLLKKRLAEKQEILGASEPELALAESLDIPLRDLQAERDLAASRMEDAKTQIAICNLEKGSDLAVEFALGGEWFDRLQQGEVVLLRMMDSDVLDSDANLTGVIENVSFAPSLGFDGSVGESSNEDQFVKITVVLTCDEDQPRLPPGTILEFVGMRQP